MTDRPDGVQRPALPITITDGSSAWTTPDVLDQGPDPAPDPRQVRRRRLTVAIVGLALLAGLGVAEVSERRAAGEAARAQAAAARVQEQRDREVVDLSLLSDWSGQASYEPATDRLLWQVLLRIRNNGPRDVEVVAVELPGVQLDEPVPLSAARESGLTLAGAHPCADARGPAPGSLPVEVLTEAGPSRVSLSLPDAVLDPSHFTAGCESGREQQLAGQPAGPG